MAAFETQRDRLHGEAVLQVIPQLDAGGAERTVIEVAEAIVQAGGRALVASAGGRLEADLADAGGVLFTNSTLPSKNPLTMRRNARWLKDIMARENVRIIHARSRAPAWSAYWAAKSSDAHFVTTYHGAYNARSSFKRWYNSVMARGDAIIANSDFIADHIRSTYPDAAPRMTTISRGVDLAQFDPGTVSSERLSKLNTSWFADDFDGLVILLPGRLTSWKGQEDAIEALGQLQDTLPDWRLVLSGDAQGRTAYVDQLTSLIAKHKLDGRVSIVGHCADMPAAYALSDLVLAPSRDPEAFGRVAAEAGAMMKPVIAADHGGQALIIEHGETGWLTPPRDPSALAQTIRHAVLDVSGDDRRHLGERARQRVAERFSKTALQEATLNVYRQLLGADS